MMRVEAAVFVAAGETLEAAQALALQAERSVVLREMQAPRTRWYTHGVLPVCPYPLGARGVGMNPWSVALLRSALWAAWFSRRVIRDWTRFTEDDGRRQRGTW